MNILRQAKPDLTEEHILAMMTEELGALLLYVIGQHETKDRFHPDSYIGELRGMFLNSEHRRIYGDGNNEELNIAFIEAFSWLESQGLIVRDIGINGQNGWKRLSRRAKAYQGKIDLSGYKASRFLPREILHELIRDKVWNYFIRADYDAAVLFSFKQVEIKLREKCNLDPSAIGVRLAEIAFSPEKGLLTDHSVDGGEKKARMFLFAGAIGSYKNPQSHRHVDLKDSVEAIEQILIASHLLRILDGIESIST